MSYNDEEWGNYDDEDYDEMEQEFFMSNDEDGPEYEDLQLRRDETSEIQNTNKNFKVEIYDPKTLKSFLTEKVNALKGLFNGFN